MDDATQEEALSFLLLRLMGSHEGQHYHAPQKKNEPKCIDALCHWNLFAKEFDGLSFAIRPSGHFARLDTVVMVVSSKKVESYVHARCCSSVSVINHVR